MLKNQAMVSSVCSSVIHERSDLVTYRKVSDKTYKILCELTTVKGKKRRGIRNVLFQQITSPAFYQCHRGFQAFLLYLYTGCIGVCAVWIRTEPQVAKRRNRGPRCCPHCDSGYYLRCSGCGWDGRADCPSCIHCRKRFL